MRGSPSAVEDVFDDLALFEDGDRGVKVGASAAEVVFCDWGDFSFSGALPWVGGEAFRLNGCLDERRACFHSEDRRGGQRGAMAAAGELLAGHQADDDGEQEERES